MYQHYIIFWNEVVFISKQQSSQKYIYKIHSSRLRKEKWKLNLTLDEARRNEEIIALADSQILRWIDELNGIVDLDEKVHDIRTEIKDLRDKDNSVQNRRRIRTLYMELDKLQFHPDYMCLIIDKEKDYYRACKGYSINGIKYRRLLGTNGGIKNSTIVFVSERLHDELDRRVNNDRDVSKEIVTAKLEAYKALTCSASIPVSMPHGVLVVDDVETEFREDIIYLSDDDGGEPKMTFKRNEPIKMDASDGFGLMLPSLASRWSEELGLDYTVAGCNTRFSFEKGMVFTFDFLDFAENVAEKYIVKDAWGCDVDIRDVELILTTSMVKLYDSYKSCDDYIQTSVKNGYTFGVTKTTPKVLESERNLNYQFIQSFDLSDDDIEELISPTMRDIKDVLSGDWRKTLLYLKGSGMNDNSFERMPDDFIKSIMIDRRMIDDPFVQNSIYQMIKNRINEAKVGVLKVHGNFSILSGDPYLLCQSIFGLEKTGLLKSGELYNKYWTDLEVGKVVCFRAPMTSANNIKVLRPTTDDKIAWWFRYMNACTIINAWDTTAAALNGADMDGDLIMLTDNNVLIRRYKPLPTIMCLQKKADKTIPTEEDFIRSNIATFGNDIGQITNRITSMFEVQSNFKPGSKEYSVLAYRIQCGQQLQQNSIDRAKGIISNPMPRSWYDRHAVNKIEDEDTKSLYRNIVADRKPYFMRYIYPALMKDYRTYIRNTNRNALREFQMTVDELLRIPEGKLTSRQSDFIKYYQYRMPVGTGDCVMNRICRRFEEEFDGYIGRHNSSTPFDYKIMRGDAGYTTRQFSAIKSLYNDYNNRLRRFSILSGYERTDDDEIFSTLLTMQDDFRKECVKICPNRFALCNIVLDLCYTRNSTKRFAWSMSGKEIIDTLLVKHDYEIAYPTLDPGGDISFGGNKFRQEKRKIEG